MKRRITSLLMALCLCLSMLPVSPVTAHAAQDSGATIGGDVLCDHHTEHTADCGYTEGTAEIPCGHEHGEDCYQVTESCAHTHDENCYPQEAISGHTSEAAGPTECGHVCGEDSGCVTEKVLNCQHEHDSGCGYTAAEPGTPCTYVCEDCAGTEDAGTVEQPEAACTCETLCTEDAVNEDCPVCAAEGADLTACEGETPEEPQACTCGTDDAAHATDCPAYVAPDDPVCSCVEKCAEDSVNVWCDVCGLQGADACEGADTAQTYDVTNSGTFGDDGSWSWTLADDGALTITGSGDMPDFTRPSDGNSSPWYDSCEEITSVVVTGDVLSVGDYAFYTCTNLTSVTLPNTVTSIGEYAFYACSSLASINLPETVTSIGQRAFYDCSKLELAELPSGLTSIGVYAFARCNNLKFTTLPDALANVDGHAFYMCENLALTGWPSGVTSILNHMFYCSTFTSTSLTLPAELTSIGELAFGGTQIDELIFTGIEAPALVGDYTFTDVIYDYEVRIGTIYVPAEGTGYTAENYWPEDYIKYLYDVTVNTSGNGTASADKTRMVKQGKDTVTLTATPEDGYHVVWQAPDGVTIEDNTLFIPDDYTGDAEVVVTATFEAHSINTATGKCSGCETELAVASVTIGGTTTYYATLADAATAAQTGTEAAPATLKLEQSVDLGESWLETSSGVFTFDLNGKTLSNSKGLCGALTISGGNVTITDSGVGGAFTNSVNTGLVCDGCTVTIEGGTIFGEIYGVEIYDSTVIINGGTISSTGTNGVGVYIDEYENTSKVTINGGTITGAQYDLLNSNATIILGLGEDGVGATFPDGLSMKNAEGSTTTLTLSAILGKGAAYWQGDKVIVLSDGQMEITGDDVTVKAECKHENATTTETTDTQHTIDCSCGYNVTEAHSTDAEGDRAATCEAGAYCSVCKREYGETDSDAHSFVYTASGNVITETCSNGCTHSETATLSAPTGTLTYDGQEKTGATVDYSDNWSGGRDLTIGYANNTNAGTATASISIDNVTASVDFTIEKADPEVTIPTGLTAAYGDTLASVVLPSGFAWTDNSLSVGDVGTNTFKVTYTPDDTKNYNVVTDIEVTVTVGKAMPTVEEPTAKELTYNGEAQELVNAGSTNGGALQYSLNETDWSTDIPTGTDAGPYTVYYRVIEDANYTGMSYPGIDVTISQKSITPTIEGLNAVYAHTGSAIEPNVTVKDGNTTLVKDRDYTVEYKNNTDVGTGTVTVTLTGNYNGEKSATFEIATHVHDWKYTASGATITARCEGTIGDCPVTGKTVTITLTAPTNLTYDGNAKTVTVTQSPEGIFDDLPGVSYSGNCKDAGAYNALLVYGGETAVVEFTIEKASATVNTAPTAIENLKYNGTAQALITAGTATGGEMQYSLDGTTYSATIPTGTDAKDYTVYYKVVGDSNHNDTTAQSITVTIEKGTAPTLTEPTASSISYGQTLSAATLSDTTWKWADGTAVPNSSGSYAAYLTVDGANYDYSGIDGYDSTTKKVTRNIQVTVNAVAPAITVTATPASAIAGKTITVTATIKNPNNESLSDLPTPAYTYQIGEGGTPTEFSGSFVIPSGTATDTKITITATTAAAGNYTAGTGTATVIVTDCTHTGNKTLKYDTASHWYICEECSAEIDKEAHSGGTATCIEKAACSTCGQPHGSKDSANHAITSVTAWEHDETHHWGTCTCGTVIEKATHSGGTSTCTEPALCSTCNQPHGEALGHSWGDWVKISDSQYQRVCEHDPSHNQTVTLSNIGDITLNLSPKVGAVLDPEIPFIGIGAISNSAASSAETGVKVDSVASSIETETVSGSTSSAEAGAASNRAASLAETVTVSDSIASSGATGTKETEEAKILADFLTGQGWQLKPLNGDWEEVTLPLTLEEKHMGGSLRYTLKGDWGEKHSREVALNPEGLWITGIEPLTYTGSKVTQSFQLYDGDTLLTEKVDYTISYKNNQKAYEPEGSTGQSGTAASAQGSDSAQGDDLAQAGSLAQNGAGAASSVYGEGTSPSAIAIVSEGGEALSLMSEGNSVSVTDVSRYNTKTAPRVVVKMKGNYKGTYTIYFPIAKPDLSEAQADDLTVTWTGKDQKPKPVVTWEGKKLVNNKDYYIEEYQDKTGYTEAGDHTLTLKGKGNYKGSKTIKLTITQCKDQIAMDKVKVSGVKAQPFSPEGAKQAGLVVKYKNTVLTEKTDTQAGEYTVSYLNNAQAGTATLVLTGTGEAANKDGTTFKGVKKVTFKVDGTAMGKVQVTGLQPPYDYTGEEIRPTGWYSAVAAEAKAADAGQGGADSTAGQTGEEDRSKVVQLKGTDPATEEIRLLVEGEDYEVSYQNNINKGTATILFTGKPEAGFTGTKKVTFKIQARIIVAEATQGEAAQGEASGTEGAQEEKAGFVIRITDPDCTTTGEGASLAYQMPYTKGGAKPAITVTYKGRVLTQGTDYKVSYKNNKAVRDTSDAKKAPTIVVTGKGNYKGTTTLAFAIIPKEVSEGSAYAGQVQVVAKDKVESTAKKNGWKQSFTVVDQDGKVLKNGTNAAADYTASKAIYTIDSLPATADSDEALENLQNLQKLKEEGTNLIDVPTTQLPAGTIIRVTIELQGSYSGTVSGTYRILARGYDISKATIRINAQEYTGKEILIDSNEDFSERYLGSRANLLYLVQEGEHEPNIRVVSYEKNIQKGTAKVTFAGIGEYGGTKTVSFKIGQRSIVTFWEGIFNGVRDLLNG